MTHRGYDPGSQTLSGAITHAAARLGVGEYSRSDPPNYADIQHYVAAYGYRSSGDYISISDSAVMGSYTASQEYDQYYADIWAAIHNHPALDAILW